MTVAKLRQIVADIEVTGEIVNREKARMIAAFDDYILTFGPEQDIDVVPWVLGGAEMFPYAGVLFEAIKSRFGITDSGLDQRDANAVVSKLREQLGEKEHRACHVRFVVSNERGPVLTALEHPSKVLVAAVGLPEGEYLIGMWCNCREFPNGPTPWGRLSNFGGGLAVVRGPNRDVYRSDPVE